MCVAERHKGVDLQVELVCCEAAALAHTQEVVHAEVADRVDHAARASGKENKHKQLKINQLKYIETESQDFV